MIGVLRICGWILMLVGGLVCATWFIEPLRNLWPLLLALPLPVQIGLVVASLGLVILVASLLYERWEGREEDRQLKEDRF